MQIGSVTSITTGRFRFSLIRWTRSPSPSLKQNRDMYFSSPVSSRSFAARRRSSSGAYVSGWVSSMSPSTPAAIRTIQLFQRQPRLW